MLPKVSQYRMGLIKSICRTAMQMATQTDITQIRIL